MNLLCFEGAAGTGKTTALVAEARKHLAAHPLQAEQRVLALTKHHGSRRRMEAKLKRPDGVGRSIDCVTIDSFAWNLLRRWRGRVRDLGLEPAEGDFHAISTAAGQLLECPGVGAWVTRRYPIVIVDELQDCKGGEVQIIDRIARHGSCLCAADAFQDLSGAADNEAVAWAKANGDVTPLSNVRRTNVHGLLSGATALRDGKPPLSDRSNGFEIITVPTAPFGAASASWRIKSWRRFGQIAIISPSRPATSPFVKKLTDWVSSNSTKESRNGATAGPYRVDWEPGEEGLRDEILVALNLPNDRDARLSNREFEAAANAAGVYDLQEWIRKQRNVVGRQSLRVGDVIDQVEEIVRRRRAFGRTGERRLVAMTVHQAKNREFESVIALWPMRVVPNSEQQRRWLYNAITRAKRQALVIVEDPKGNRLGLPPFKIQG